MFQYNKQCYFSVSLVEEGWKEEIMGFVDIAPRPWAEQRRLLSSDASDGRWNDYFAHKRQMSFEVSTLGILGN